LQIEGSTFGGAGSGFRVQGSEGKPGTGDGGLGMADGHKEVESTQYSVLSTQYSVHGNPQADRSHTNRGGKQRGFRDSDTAGPRWVRVGLVDDFPVEGGAAVKYGRVQIAVFRFSSRGEWFACQNMCPHKRAFVLSRGILGTQADAPKVACPLHKKTFSLATGECLSGDEHSVKVFPVKVTGDDVLLLLPPQEQLDALLATELHSVTACETLHAHADHDAALATAAT
jgi:NAD(P)H-dependent nitrite reductase small subunit